MGDSTHHGRHLAAGKCLRKRLEASGWTRSAIRIRLGSAVARSHLRPFLASRTLEGMEGGWGAGGAVGGPRVSLLYGRVLEAGWVAARCGRRVVVFGACQGFEEGARDIVVLVRLGLPEHALPWWQEECR